MNNNKIKEIDIKNRACYFNNINIRDLNLNLMKIFHF